MRKPVFFPLLVVILFALFLQRGFIKSEGLSVPEQRIQLQNVQTEEMLDSLFMEGDEGELLWDTLWVCASDSNDTICL